MESSKPAQQSSFMSSYMGPAANAGLGITLAAIAAFGSAFVMRKYDFTSLQIRLGGGLAGGVVLASYIGSAVLGARAGKAEALKGVDKSGDSNEELKAEVSRALEGAKWIRNT